jgi:hypothetical protein
MLSIFILRARPPASAVEPGVALVGVFAQVLPHVMSKSRRP